MGGTTARIATAAVAFCGMLSLGAPAIAAVAPLDGAAQAVPPVSQTVDALAPPAVKQAVSIVRDTANVPPPIERETPGQGGGRAAASNAPVQHGPRSMRGVVTQRAAAAVAAGTRPVEIHARPESNRPSPPHGRKAMPPARFHRERAGARSAHRSHAATSAPRHSPEPRPGLAGWARALEGPAASVLAAFLLGVLVAFLPFDLRPLRVPAPISRRLAFVSPIDPPG